MNRVMLVGRLTKDLEKRITGTGTPFLYFTVAINRRVSAGKEPQADFINCVAWEKTAELMAQYLSKGSRVGVEGRITSRNYEKDGARVFITEVVAERVEFLDSKPSSGQSIEERIPTYTPEQDFDTSPSFDEAFSMEAFDASDEDLPF